mgnify:CR=1 FL=1
MRIIQELTAPRAGAVWSMKFSLDGRLLATGGQVRIAARELSHASQNLFSARPPVLASKFSMAPSLHVHAFENTSSEPPKCEYWR